MMNTWYDLNTRTRKTVREYAKENGYPEPSLALQPILSALVVKHKLSIICAEIDEITDRLFLLHDRIDIAIEEGNLTCIVLLRERLEEEKKKLAAMERLLKMEAPMKQKPAEGEITEEMIQRARDYPFENLLTEGLQRGRCRCKIHSGKNPTSFEVKNNYGRCHSCGWHGDALKYFMDTQGISFPEAVRKLS